MVLSFKEATESFSVLAELKDSGQCRIDDPINITVSILPEKEMFKVKGSISFTVRLACGRCLTDVAFCLSRRFTLRYSRQIPADVHRNDGTEVEVTADSIGLIYFQGDEIDLRHTIQEQVVMALPFRPLCREGCKGLCPRCGTDLNQERCACRVDHSDSPFEVLQQRHWPGNEQDRGS